MNNDKITWAGVWGAWVVIVGGVTGAGTAAAAVAGVAVVDVTVVVATIGATVCLLYN